MTKHIVFNAKTVKGLQDGLNEISLHNEVFATQTHVTYLPESKTMQYTAVCFAKGDPEPVEQKIVKESVKEEPIDLDIKESNCELDLEDMEL